MPHRPASLALMAGAAFLSLSAGSGPAVADDFLETVYLPASSVVTMPSSALMPTSYLVPTSYAPSAFLPTSAIYMTGEVVVPTATSYVVPRYRSFRYRPRRYVERTAYYASPSYPLATTSYLAPTSYLATTSYLAPTSYVVPARYFSTSFVEPTSYLVDSGLIATSASMSMCCESGSMSAPSRTTTTRSAPSSGAGSGGNMITSTPSSGPANERMPSGTVDDGISSRVDPQAPATSTQTTPPPPTPAGPAGAEGVRPVEEPKPADLPVPKRGDVGSDLPPAPPKIDKMTFRDARKPAFPLSTEPRNILRGRVVSFDSGRPEESVTVVLASKTGSFADRTAMTDADGDFKVSLPQGDWVVKVKMPSGSVLPVGRDYLTASSGKITDPSGRNVNDFTIKR